MMLLDVAIVGLIGVVLARIFSLVWVAGMLVAIVLPPILLSSGIDPNRLPVALVPLCLVFDTLFVLLVVAVHTILIPRNETLRSLVFPARSGIPPSLSRRLLSQLILLALNATFTMVGCGFGLLVFSLLRVRG